MNHLNLRASEGKQLRHRAPHNSAAAHHHGALTTKRDLMSA